MPRGRVEAFSDAIIAIAITVMVLELPKPDGVDWTALRSDLPVLLTYVLSFLYLGIYWNNHHHMFAAVSRVNGAVLWANLHLLFWLSLVPFVTGWMSDTEFRTVPTAVYGVVLLAAGIAYAVLQQALLRAQGPDSRLRAAIGRDLKGKASPVLYCVGIAVTFVMPLIGLVVYSLIGLMWLIPDRRVERTLQHDREHERAAPPSSVESPTPPVE